ncbi:hypothetical protein [Sphingobium bisphenolivorans]|uniref:hypothetical protein n=1 Tax=Sphingobium bisphenolivorans TaxID=1335760 RepID=UPI0003A633BC|nr:hypothetical protein [Sphingobium bisphenolivorans]
MVEDRDSGYSIHNRDHDEKAPANSRGGSGIIFALVAIALILAIAFFYVTKDRGDNRADTVTNAAESADSAARVVGDAAKNAADELRDR